jgi:hypothetical protein
MLSVRFQKRIVRQAKVVFAMLLVYTMNCLPAHAAPCVQDYLTTVLPILEQRYIRIKSASEVGFVPVTRYSSPKNNSSWTSDLRSAEVGEIRRRDLSYNHWLSKWVKKVNAQGGEVRLLEFERLQANPQLQDKWEKFHEYGAYFTYDPESKTPYIAVSAAATPDTVAHECDHLEKWMRLRNDLLSDKRHDLQSASEEATRVFLEDVNVKLYAERAAVKKELQKDAEIQRRVTKNNPVKWMYPSGALPFTDLEILTGKLVYPEIEAVKLALENKQKPEATLMMRALIRKFLLLRLTAYQRAHDAMIDHMHSTTDLKLNVIDHVRYMRALESLDHAFDSLMVFDKERFEAAQVYGEAKNLFETEFPSVWESLPAQKRGKFKPRFNAK